MSIDTPNRQLLVDVSKQRRRARMVLRASVVVLVFMAARQGAAWARWEVEPFSYYDSDWSGFATQIGFYVCAAVVLVTCEPWIIRWVVPFDTGACIGCGYPVEGARCPECGLPAHGHDQTHPEEPAS